MDGGTTFTHRELHHGDVKAEKHTGSPTFIVLRRKSTLRMTAAIKPAWQFGTYLNSGHTLTYHNRSRAKCALIHPD